jgi:hypothetical protein
MGIPFGCCTGLNRRIRRWSALIPTVAASCEMLCEVLIEAHDPALLRTVPNPVKLLQAVEMMSLSKKASLPNKSRCGVDKVQDGSLAHGHSEARRDVPKGELPDSRSERYDCRVPRLANGTHREFRHREPALQVCATRIQ